MIARVFAMTSFDKGCIIFSILLGVLVDPVLLIGCVLALQLVVGFALIIAVVLYAALVMLKAAAIGRRSR